MNIFSVILARVSKLLSCSAGNLFWTTVQFGNWTTVQFPGTAEVLMTEKHCLSSHLLSLDGLCGSHSIWFSVPGTIVHSGLVDSNYEFHCYLTSIYEFVPGRSGFRLFYMSILNIECIAFTFTPLKFMTEFKEDYKIIHGIYEIFFLRIEFFWWISEKFLKGIRRGPQWYNSIFS